MLCSRDEIFPFDDQTTVPYGIGVLSGDKYAPIRLDIYCSDNNKLKSTNI